MARRVDVEADDDLDVRAALAEGTLDSLAYHGRCVGAGDDDGYVGRHAGFVPRKTLAPRISP